MLKIAGALHKTTNVYTTPSNAIKGEKYKCFECNDDIIFKKGVKVIPHFSHKPKSNCSYFSNGESDEHKNAKIILKYIIDNNIPLFINRQCGLCNDIKEYSIFKDEASSIQLEHRFEYNGLKIADVAMIKDGDISYVFEILKTHKTKEEDRYGEWFEINADDLIDSYTNYVDKISLMCAREYCKKCNDKNLRIRNYNLSKNPIEKKTFYRLSDSLSIKIDLKLINNVDVYYSMLFDPITNFDRFINAKNLIDTDINKYKDAIRCIIDRTAHISTYDDCLKTWSYTPPVFEYKENGILIIYIKNIVEKRKTISELSNLLINKNIIAIIDDYDIIDDNKIIDYKKEIKDKIKICKNKDCGVITNSNKFRGKYQYQKKYLRCGICCNRKNEFGGICTNCCCIDCGKVEVYCSCTWICDNCHPEHELCTHCNKNYSLCNCKQYTCEVCNEIIENTTKMHVCTICNYCGISSDACQLVYNEQIYCIYCTSSQNKNKLINCISEKIKEEKLRFGKLNFEHSREFLHYAKFKNRLQIRIECKKDEFEKIDDIVLDKNLYDIAIKNLKKIEQHKISYIFERESGYNIYECSSDPINNDISKEYYLEGRDYLKSTIEYYLQLDFDIFE